MDLRGTARAGRDREERAPRARGARGECPLFVARREHAARGAGSDLRHDDGMTPDEIREIKKIPLFREIDDAVIVAVEEVGSSRDVKAGEVIFRTGDPGDHLYIVLAGAVRIHMIKDGHEF